MYVLLLGRMSLFYIIKSTTHDRFKNILIILSIMLKNIINLSCVCFLLVLILDHVREFTCGKLYYRTFHMEENHDALYVGAM